MYYNSLGGYGGGGVKTQSVSNMPKMRLAQAYVPRQEFKNLYDAQGALKHGTIFMDLHAAAEENWKK